MTLEDARLSYKNGAIQMLGDGGLEEIFFAQASKEEITRFWQSPVYDRGGVIMGKTKKELDAEFGAFLCEVDKIEKSALCG